MKKDIQVLRYSLLFVFLFTKSFIFQAFCTSFLEKNEVKFQSYDKLPILIPSASYENPILRAWGDGGGEDDLEPGGGTDPEDGFVDPLEIPAGESIWVMPLLALIYAYCKYWIRRKKKNINFLQ